MYICQTTQFYYLSEHYCIETKNTYSASGLLKKQVCGGVTTNYTYDSRLRLTKETTGSQSISYVYDAYNRLIKKTYSIDGATLVF